MSKKAMAKPAMHASALLATRSTGKVTKSGMIRARVLPELRSEAEDILNQIGLSPSDAIRMFYKQVVLCGGLPFDARIPNATTRKALRDADAGRNLTRYADADDLFRKLGVKRGKSKIPTS
jgi:DNA-damage-inducible protein J